MNAREKQSFAAVDAAIKIAAPTFPPLEDEQTNQPDKVVLVAGSTLKPMPVAWLWRHWLALKKLHILAGMPGQGKTTLAILFAAIVSTGGRWPDGTNCPVGNVIFWSGEDDPADTLVPRLAAAGADLNRCYFITGAQRGGEVIPFDPAIHLGMLRAQVGVIGGVSLLVVDPVVSAVTGDSHKNGEVRRALQPLVELAAECNCAVLGITHFSKGGQGSDPSQRVVGSVAFTAVARVVLVAAKVKSEDGMDTRILARSKSNIGPDSGGFEYHLEQIENADGIHASRVSWGKAVEGTARDLLTDPNEDDATSEAQDVAGFLSSLLSDGPMSAKDIFKDADGAGYSRDQIKRASIKLNVEKRKNGMDGGWRWALSSPEGSTKGAKSAPFETPLPSRSSVLPSGDGMEVI